MPYHSPQDCLDAALSPETPASELALLAKVDYIYARVAVAQNPNVTTEILTALVRGESKYKFHWGDLAEPIISNPKTSAEALSLFAEELILALDNAEHKCSSTIGLYLCSNPKTPFEYVQRILTLPKASTLFRRRVASRSRRQDVLEFLLTDKSEAVRKRAINSLALLRQNAIH